MRTVFVTRQKRDDGMSENKELKSAYNYGRDSGYADGFVDGYKAGVKDAKPKNGKWIKENRVLTSNPPQYVWHCSECGNPERGFSIHILTNHCPACGAKMEVEK